MLNTVVMKFGGTSVGSIERIQAVAKRVYREVKEAEKQVVVVVSAMSGETDRLLSLGRQLGSDLKSQREFDQLVTSGEQASSALTAIALKELGIESRSFLAHQLPLKTKWQFGQNLIADIDPGKIKACLGEGIVPVVAGFQGVNDRGDITTLGRGGSDTTAVALAAVLGPCPCYILTDVDGVYTTSPKIVPEAKKLEHVSYEEMLELARAGAKVLQTRSVSLARKFKVPLYVCTSFSDEPGSEIVEEFPNMEDAVVSGVTTKSGESKVSLWNIPDRPGVAATFFRAIAEAHINVDMIVQSQGEDGLTRMSFTVPEEDAPEAEKALEPILKSEFPGAKISVESGISKVSVVGEGMRNHSGVAAEVFEVLSKTDINVELITTSEIRISVAVKSDQAEDAVRSLHDAFIK